MVCVNAACPPNSIPVRTTGSSSARAAYRAAESPAGPEPSTSTLTCLGSLLVEEEPGFKDIVNLVSSIGTFYQMPQKRKGCKRIEIALSVGFGKDRPVYMNFCSPRTRILCGRFPAYNNLCGNYLL